ncbi:MAG: OmpA family protein [Saprospiraceae bacterium]|nr:OmpA family protein [Saprospiraceae bacterium]MCB9342597.1 OmpA family protein [Lewinellaceae bacterium]
MRTPFFIILLALPSLTTLKAQKYPENPEPGACYIRCPIEEIKEVAKVTTTPSYMDYKIVPAEYKTVEEKVLVKEASKKFEYVPAVYTEVTETILVEEPINKISLLPVETLDTFETFEISPAYSRFETRPALDDCDSPVPGDCDVICYVYHEAVTKSIPVKKILKEPGYDKEAQEGKYKTIKKRVIQTPATYREIEIPAEYITINKRVLVKDETVDSFEVKPVLREEVYLVNEGNTSNEGYEWRKIECTLLDFNILPIYYALNSAALDSRAKTVIDEKLYDLLAKRPEIRIEINSHTDSRSSDSYNLELSTRRAKAVVDYLASRGIKRSRMVYHGYGETQLVNHCSNGVQCSEEEHAKNRRTEFRVLPH